MDGADGTDRQMDERRNKKREMQKDGTVVVVKK